MELKKSNDLFYLAHNLVDIYPGKAVSWFAVGCYYMLVSKHETARRFKEFDMVTWTDPYINSNRCAFFEPPFYSPFGPLIYLSSNSLLYYIEEYTYYMISLVELSNDAKTFSTRFLSKATSLDRVFGPAWLAFGHSFAAENEHDQAMAAYFTASQV